MSNSSDSESVEMSNDGEEDNLITNEDDRKKISDQLSHMSFEDLQKLKNKIGSKLYNKTVHGIGKIKKTTFKRVNKNRPRERSSKKQIKLEQDSLLPSKQHLPRDPRFEAMCGSFSKETFKDNYKFVNDLRKKEKEQLEEQLKNTKDPEEKKRIKLVLQRLNNQVREEEKREQHRRQKKEVQEGDKKIYKKKSVQKLEGLISQFEELKKTNKLQKHIERRAKKISTKDRKKLRSTE